MIDTEERRRPTDQAKDYVASKFTPRTIGSLVLAIVLFIIAVILVFTNAPHVEVHFALYAAGLTFAACGFVMLVGCGASSGHGGVAICTATVLERRGRQLDRHLEQMKEEAEVRFDSLEEGQRRLANVLMTGMQNELAHRRDHD